jgi:acyl-CoA synthetase (AMP-forming)/AMP-acid ligase II
MDVGLMQQQPLLISSLLVHAERHHGDQEIVSRRVEGDIHRTTYKAWPRARAAWPRHWPRWACNRATASPRWPGTATATWSCTSRSAASGAVLHTLNPRLHPDQVVWIADHAEDQVLFFDLTFLPLVQAVAGR